MLTKFMNTAATLALIAACTAAESKKVDTVQMSETAKIDQSAKQEVPVDLQPASGLTEARFVEIEDFKSDFAQSRNITIWLPAGYDPSGNHRYPVIYAHDGQNLFQPGSSYGGVEWGLDETASEMMAAGQLPPAIIVGIWNTDKRWQEYAPQKVIERLDTSGGSTWLGDEPPELLGDDYLKFLTEELKPYVDATYETAPGPETTFIMGSSMGGLISLYAAAEYPNIFGRAAAVSIHWPLAEPEGAIAAQADSAMQAYLEDSKLDRNSQRLWFDNGTETLDQFYPPHVAAMKSWFRAKGWKDDEAIFRTYEGTEHSEAAWAARADDILTFLLTD